MKKYSILYITAVVLFSACTKQLKTYDGTASVYFHNAVHLTNLTDTSLITFSFTPKTMDSLIGLQINVTGDTVNYAREYTLGIAANSTAKPGVHYDILTSDFTIAPGEFRDMVYIVLHRTTDMITNTFDIRLELQPNEYFNTDLPVKKVNTTRYISVNSYRVMVNDIVRKPKFWLDAYLGTFTRKKFFLMAELLGIPLDKLDTSVAVAELVYYGKFMQRYLNEQKAFGNTIKEEDGSDMVMGSAVQ